MTTLISQKNQLSGVATLISVDRRMQKPIYLQIYESFRSRIVRRELRPGQLVPSTRQLARELRVSRFPVLNAYAQLLAEGYFESRTGAGTFIASSLPEEPATTTSKAVAKPARTWGAIAPPAAILPRTQNPPGSTGPGPFPEATRNWKHFR